MVPMISSICKGSLGVCQLPRTWWKTLTRAVNLLDSAYPDNSGGLDTWCLQAIELDIDETYDYLRSELPDYVTFERWILDRKNNQLPAARVERFNEIVKYRRHIRPHKITETYADIGFDPDVDTYTSALLLNTLQDWHLFHANDYNSDQHDIPANISPLVSSIEQVRSMSCSFHAPGTRSFSKRRDCSTATILPAAAAWIKKFLTRLVSTAKRPLLLSAITDPRTWNSSFG